MSEQSQHLGDEDVLALRAGSLTFERARDAAAHLSACEACRAKVEASQEVSASTAALWDAATSDEVGHLDFDSQLVPYVDGTLAALDRQLVDDHLADCAQCRAEVDDLQRFRTSLTADAPSNIVRMLTRAAWIALPAAAALIVIFFLVSHSRQAEPRHPPVAQTLPATGTQPPTTHSDIQTLTQLHDGSTTLRVAPDGALVNAPFGDWNERVASALATGAVAKPAVLAALTSGADTLRGSYGDTNTPRLVAPLGVVVEETKPRFEWTPIAGATYRIAVYDTDFHEVAQSPTLHATSWTPPHDLARGRTYLWQVTTEKNGTTTVAPSPDQPQAQLRVASAAQARELAQARASGSHLLTGVVYAEAGIVDGAERELAAFAAENPRSPAAASLLATVRSWRSGRTTSPSR